MITNLVLGDSLEVLIDHRGKTPGKLGSEFTTSGVPVASAILVKDGRLDLSEARFVDESTWKRWMGVPTQVGDVLLTSEAPLGRVARVESNGPLVLGQRLFALRGKAGVLDSAYLYYALQMAQVQADLLGRSTGTTVFGIRQAALRQVVIPAPAFPEQQAIAEVLGALDVKIAANDRLIEVADQLAEGITTSSCSGELVPLVSVALVTMGSSPPGATYNERSEGMPFFQGVRDFGIRNPDVRVFTTAPVRTADVDDTLVSVRAPVGRTNLARSELCLGRGLAGLRSRTDQPMTLFHQVRAAHASWAPYEAEGTIFGAINRTQLEAIQLPAVREEIARDLEGRLQAIEGRIASALAENRKLRATRDELLPLLMSGKVKVRDAVKAAQEVL